MALPGNYQDKEIDKFDEDAEGRTFVRTYNLGSLITFKYDTLSLAYDSTTLENVTNVVYIKSGTTMGTLTLAYDSTTLTNVTSVVKTP